MKLSKVFCDMFRSTSWKDTMPWNTILWQYLCICLELDQLVGRILCPGILSYGSIYAYVQINQLERYDTLSWNDCLWGNLCLCWSFQCLVYGNYGTTSLYRGNYQLKNLRYKCQWYDFFVKMIRKDDDVLGADII